MPERDLKQRTMAGRQREAYPPTAGGARTRRTGEGRSAPSWCESGGQQPKPSLWRQPGRWLFGRTFQSYASATSGYHCCGGLTLGGPQQHSPLNRQAIRWALWCTSLVTKGLECRQPPAAHLWPKQLGRGWKGANPQSAHMTPPPPRELSQAPALSAI